MKKIETICKTFLWTGGTYASKRALLSWDKVCPPKTAGGFHVLDIQIWNKAAICKLLWNLCRKKDKLWVRWIHLYYGKKQEVWDIKPRNASWIVQKIIKAKRYIEVVGVSMKEVAEWNYFSIKKCYNGMRGQLLTRSRLHAWGVAEEVNCPLCNEVEETIDHLLFKCRIAGGIWNKLLQWHGITRTSMEGQREIQWAEGKATGNNAHAQVYRLTLACAMYHIWNERNIRVFQEQQKTVEVIVSQIVQEITIRGSKNIKTEKRIAEIDYYM
ncbi:uncharacterized protein LOC142162107 [Nicotiana tabacum]|uniref:Uncharacterized protein LOC142162107 n=1 Tax=Nicotiana tabacum TaxID=4097 RepID=A0AC58RP59_TOBAC